MNKTILIFSPHPDDETLGCGGTIVKKLSEGYDVHVVLMTDGRHSHDYVLGMNELSPDKIRSIRKAEFRNAMKILGIKENNFILLDFEDGKLNVFFKQTKKKVKDVLLNTNPAEIYIPYRHDDNKSHKDTFIVVSQVLKELDISPRIYEYPIWSRKKNITEYDTEHIITQDITEQLEIKKEAINCYRSQISIIFPNQSIPVLQKSFIEMFLQNIEVFFKTDAITS